MHQSIIIHVTKILFWVISTIEFILAHKTVQSSSHFLLFLLTHPTQANQPTRRLPIPHKNAFSLPDHFAPCLATYFASNYLCRCVKTP
ncbi:hypothetical protein RhiirB3_419090 [Rhizophagus irregularis]|uniref:Uncharacterized protein n=1 Tax=Rhizophagus irregularis TaxID=588596 RepID=A0A2I1H9L8_9GLOM|nr:hypothetical protein RhiirB3_419090 [Rhizophagus irregularis]PKY55568.1 hypothetical protein RhiirA4_410621 [Rhizophagus irregularis]